MKRIWLALLSCVIWTGLIASPSIAQTSSLPTEKERDAAIGAAGNLFGNLTGSRFTRKGSYWETTYKGLTVVVYKQAAKAPANVAFTAPNVKLGALIPFAGTGEFSKIMLKHGTMIIVSPNSFLKDKQGRIDASKLAKPVATDIASLPAPIAKAIKKANPRLKSVTLPTGIYTISQFQPGTNKFVTGVFKHVGLGNPVVSSAIVDASNYQDLARLKAAFSLSILLDRDNPLNRSVELTQILTSPKDAQPVLTLFAKKGGQTLGISYQAPYLVHGKTTPVQTAISFSRQKEKVGWSLAVDIGNMTNPKLVPKVVELKGVTMEKVRVSIGFTPVGRKGPEISVGYSSSKMVVKRRTSYSPVEVSVAMTPAGAPTGALIDIKTRQTVDLAAIADLAEVGFSAHPTSKVVPKELKSDLADKLKLTELPRIGIKAPQIYVATPGMVRTGHLADLDIGIQGAGVQINGTLAAFDKNLAKAGLLLDTKGLKSAASIKPFSAGPLALKNASFDLNARLKTKPSFAIHGKVTFEGVTFAESELKFSSSGFKWVQDFGCAPPMTRTEIAFKGFKPKTPSIKPSGCAGRLAGVALDAGKAAAEQVGRGTKKAAEGTIAAGKATGKWATDTASAVGKFAKDTGCKVSSFFGGNCSKKKREAERKKRRKAALARAEKYRRVPGPAHCATGWYWNHKYRNCWFGTEGKMLVYSFSGAANGRCMQLTDGSRKPGTTLILGNCDGNGRQQFTMVPLEKNNEFQLKTVRGLCLSANIGKKKQGVRVKTRSCNASENHRWHHDAAGRLVSAKGLCLRSKSRNQKGSPLIMDDCASVSPADKSPPVEWVAVAPSTNAARNFHAKYDMANRSRLTVGGRGKFGNLCLQSDSLTPQGKIRLKKCNRSEAQKFAIGHIRGRFFALVSQKSRMCLDLFAWKKRDGALIVTWPCHYEGNEQWIAVVGGETTTSERTLNHPSGFMIKSAATGKCLGPVWVRGKVFASEGAVIKQVKCNPKDVNLRFKFTRLYSH